jgi:hypothetical protein
MSVDVHGEEVLIETERFPAFSVGDTVYVRFDTEAVLLV